MAARLISEENMYSHLYGHVYGHGMDMCTDMCTDICTDVRWGICCTRLESSRSRQSENSTCAHIHTCARRAVGDAYVRLQLRLGWQADVNLAAKVISPEKEAVAGFTGMFRFALS